MFPIVAIGLTIARNEYLLRCLQFRRATEGQGIHLHLATVRMMEQAIERRPIPGLQLQDGNVKVAIDATCVLRKGPVGRWRWERVVFRWWAIAKQLGTAHPLQLTSIMRADG